jgi:hypothetical protein
VTRVMVIASAAFLSLITGYAGQTNQADPVSVPSKQKASKPAQKTQKAKQSSAAPAPGQSGAVVFVDPVTHQVREATPADIGTLSRPSQGARRSDGAARSAAETANPPSQIQGAGGAVGISLGPDFDTYVVVTKTPDGKLRTEELTGNKAAQERVLPGKTAKTTK